MFPEAQQNIVALPVAEKDLLTTLRDAFRKIRKHWPLVVAVTATVALAVTFRTLGQKKIYEATATVMFDPSPPRPLGRDVDTVADFGASNFWSNKEYYETQYKLMASMRVAVDVVHELQLQHNGAFLANAPPGGKFEPKEETPEGAAGILLARTDVTPIKNSRLAVLRYEDANPQRAQQITEAMVNAYVNKNLDDVLASTNSAAEWLNGQLDSLKGGVDETAMALHEYKLKKDILSVDMDAQSNMLREEMLELNKALTAARIRRVELDARSTGLSKVDTQDPTNLPATELLQSPILTELRSKYVEARRDLDALKAKGRGENHPEARAAEAQVRVAREALVTEVKNIRGAVQRDLSDAHQQEGKIGGLFTNAKNRALDLNLLEIEFSRLARSKQENEKLYSLVLERTKESDLARMLRVNNIRIIDRPLEPKIPVYPRVTRNVVLGVLAGLMLGLVAALMREALDRSIKTQDDLEGEVGLAFLGLIPQVDEAAKKSGYYGRRRRRHAQPGTQALPDLVVHEFPMSGVAEAARAIRTNLLFMSPDHPFRTLVVTSPGPSEGKTTVACCIAIAMAQAGQRVALVDCDLRRPRVHRIFGKSSDRGLTSALLDPSALEEALIQTQVPNLSALPAGPMPPNPSELLQSEKFGRLLASIRERFDRVVIDSPPVGPVTDSAILSTQVDGTVLVVRAFGTPKEHARQARRAIMDVGGHLVGAVLNAVNLEKSEYKHYQYAYYKRSGYYRTQAEQPSPMDPLLGGREDQRPEERAPGPDA